MGRISRCDWRSLIVSALRTTSLASRHTSGSCEAIVDSNFSAIRSIVQSGSSVVDSRSSLIFFTIITLSPASSACAIRHAAHSARSPDQIDFASASQSRRDRIGVDNLHDPCRNHYFYNSRTAFIGKECRFLSSGHPTCPRRARPSVANNRPRSPRLAAGGRYRVHGTLGRDPSPRSRERGGAWFRDGQSCRPDRAANGFFLLFLNWPDFCKEAPLDQVFR